MNYFEKHYQLTGNKMIDKIIINSYYPAHSNNYLILFDEDKSNEITKEGLNLIEELKNNYDNSTGSTNK